MPTRPTVLVIGATGRQGGSVARHLLAAGRMQVRALTRRPHADEARALGALGAEVVRGDLADVDSLRAAMRGAQAVFGMTDWWEHFEAEEVHGRALVEAALAAKVPHVVLSTQPSAREALGGTTGMDPFESKATLERYARAALLPATYVHVSFYWENLLSLVVPRPIGNGRFALALPIGDARLGGIGEDDIGGVVAAVLAQAAATAGRTVNATSDARRAGEIAAMIAAATGREVIARTESSRAPWARIPGGEALAAALDRTFAVYRARQDGLDTAVAQTRRLFPQAQPLETWVHSHAHELRWTLDRFEPRTERPKRRSRS